MKNEAITLKVGNGTLHAVPSIHYRLSFTRIVNSICTNPRTRPDAIAVELGPQTAAFLRRWIGELHSQKNIFPVMLGLMMRCQVIRPSLEKKAMLLQDRYGRDLSEISLEVLQRELDYCPETIFPLSPTDSIIEGVRCATTYDLPLYGVDLEEVPEEERDSAMLIPKQMDALSRFTLRDGVSCCAHLPLWESDRRREFAMAARLKTLLQLHENVVFICGMGHWRRIETLLSNPDLRPAVVQKNVSITEGRFQRVIVSPETAMRFIDLFPALGMAWEEYRAAGESAGVFPNAEEIFRTILERSYRKYFMEPSGVETPQVSSRTSLYACRDFENYLRNLAILEQYPVPDFFLTMTAARETMNVRFVKTLLKTFMEYPWASDNDFPDDRLSVVCDSGRKDGTMIVESDYTMIDGFVRALKEADPPINLPREESDKPMQDKPNSIGSGVPFTWIVWDRLITLASIRANSSACNQQDYIPTEFMGSILEGFDVKATLRAYSRGKKKLYVREHAMTMSMPEEKLDAFPVVWIFSKESHIKDNWTLQIFAGEHLRPYVRNRQEFDRQVGSRSVMISLVGYARDRSFNTSYPVFCDTFSGISVYQPTCFSNRQQALWLEQMSYGSAPILEESSMSKLNAMFSQRFKIDLKQYNWKTCLILSAIPFAKSAVTVVAPDDYIIEAIVLETARRFNVTIYQTKLSLFQENEVKRLTMCHFAPCLTIDPIYRYSEEVEQIIGERQTDYSELIPREVAEFGQMV